MQRLTFSQPTEHRVLPTVVFGGLLSVIGLYALLTRGDSTKGVSDDATERSTTVLDQLTSQTGTGYALSLTGLLILTASTSRPAAWWGESILNGAVPTGAYWLGALAALGGAFAVTFATSDRTAFAGMALAGTGGALLFGLAGNLVAGIGMVSVAAAGGWATRLLPQPQDSSAPSFPEPLLLTVAVVGLFVLTASTLHRSATTESPHATSYETGNRTLPRPSVARRQQTNRAPDSDGRASIANDATSPGESPWQSAATYSLLILVAGLGVWQQFTSQGTGHAAETASVAATAGAASGDESHIAIPHPKKSPPTPGDQA